MKPAQSPKSSGYYHYFAFGLESWIARLLIRIREDVFQIFVTTFRPAATHTILDVGVSAEDHPSSNHFEKRYPYTGRICGLSVQHVPELRAQFSGITLVEGDARALPFADRSFDFVYSHAVIEHVGSRAQQAQFLLESLRVARLGILITTPNRWHPIETHTGLPLLHFLPARVFRPVYKALGKGMYATEAALNLMGAPILRGLLKEVYPKETGLRLHRVRWLGLASNLVIIVVLKPS